MFEKIYLFDETFCEKYMPDVRLSMQRYYIENWGFQAQDKTMDDFWGRVRSRGLDTFTKRYVEFGQKLLRGEVRGYRRVVPYDYPTLSVSLLKSIPLFLDFILDELKEDFARRLAQLEEKREEKNESESGI